MSNYALRARAGSVMNLWVSSSADTDLDDYPGVAVPGRVMISSEKRTQILTPERITTARLVAWFRSERMVRSGANVAAMPNDYPNAAGMPDLRPYTAGTYGGALTHSAFRRGHRQAVASGTLNLKGTYGAARTQPLTYYIAGTWCTDDAATRILIDGTGSNRNVVWHAAGGNIAMLAGTNIVTAAAPPLGKAFVARFVFSGASSSIYIEAKDQTPIFITGINCGTQGVDGLRILAQGDGLGGYFTGGGISELIAFDTALVSGQDEIDMLQYLRRKYDLRSAKVLCVGNSLMAGTGSSSPNTVPELLASTTAPLEGVVNLAHGGETTPQLTARILAEVVPAKSLYTDDVLVLWEGGNDIYFGATVAEAAQHFADYVLELKARNYRGKLIICTVGPRAIAGGWTAQKGLDLNALIRANYNSWGFHGLADLALDPALATPATDGTHYNATQYQLITSSYVRPAVRAVMRTTT